MLHPLVKQIHAGAIDQERDLFVAAHEKLGEHDVEYLSGIVFLRGKELINRLLHHRNIPVSYSGWTRIEQAFWKKLFPLWMLKRDENDLLAEFFENGFVLHPLTFFS